ncbi:hypothetical protein RND81_01G082500 [Saponaria officinalis]|uniref:Uncharacterized protein n=1 Tax=Saponaria officinalis TaxID=3572 RepID=A0AAW1NDE2_SAPOF
MKLMPDSYPELPLKNKTHKTISPPLTLRVSPFFLLKNSDLNPKPQFFVFLPSPSSPFMLVLPRPDHHGHHHPRIFPRCRHFSWRYYTAHPPCATVPEGFDRFLFAASFVFILFVRLLSPFQKRSPI